MINVYITNLAKYNEGYLIGDWVTLPLPPEDLDEVIAEILEDDEEYFITDYECEFMEIPEYCNLHKLNELAEQLNDLDEHEQKKVKAILEWGAYRKLEDAINNVDNFRLDENINSENDLAWYFLNEVYADVPDFIKGYVDIKRLGRDLIVDGYISEYGYIEEC